MRAFSYKRGEEYEAVCVVNEVEDITFKKLTTPPDTETDVIQAFAAEARLAVKKVLNEGTKNV